MTDDHPQYPHPDGLRTGRWDVRRRVIGSAERFGTRLADVVVWTSRPIGRSAWADSQLRNERISFATQREAIDYATRKARTEQRTAYRHHIRQEQHT